MFYAAQAGQHKILQLMLVERRMDPNYRDYYGLTVLSVAVRNGHRELVEFLLSIHDINANVEDNFGRTPLSWAVEMMNPHLVRLLTGIGGVKNLAMENDSSLLNEGPGVSDHLDASCDVCMVNHRKGHVYYTCDVCWHGRFCICSDCFEIGAHCLDICHSFSKANK
jgi:ankyrin repeat protein